MGWVVQRATGRSKCRICDKKIKKDAIEVEHSEFRCTRKVHLECLVAQAEKIKNQKEG